MERGSLRWCQGTVRAPNTGRWCGKVSRFHESNKLTGRCPLDYLQGKIKIDEYVTHHRKFDEIGASFHDMHASYLLITHFAALTCVIGWGLHSMRCRHVINDGDIESCISKSIRMYTLQTQYNYLSRHLYEQVVILFGQCTQIRSAYCNSQIPLSTIFLVFRGDPSDPTNARHSMPNAMYTSFLRSPVFRQIQPASPRTVRIKLASKSSLRTTRRTGVEIENPLPRAESR